MYLTSWLYSSPPVRLCSGHHAFAEQRLDPQWPLLLVLGGVVFVLMSILSLNRRTRGSNSRKRKILVTNMCTLLTHFNVNMTMPLHFAEDLLGIEGCAILSEKELSPLTRALLRQRVMQKVCAYSTCCSFGDTGLCRPAAHPLHVSLRGSVGIRHRRLQLLFFSAASFCSRRALGLGLMILVAVLALRNLSCVRITPQGRHPP